MEDALKKAGFNTGEGGGGGSNGGNSNEAAEKREQQEEMRRNMLSSLLTGEAKERLARVSMVRPENARAVENHIINLARQRKLQDRVDENVLVAMLEQVSDQAKELGGGVKKVTIVRKKRAGEDDDDDDDDF
jgi:programmed cell death protein 5